MKIRVLIVDDEPLARKGVALRLREQSDCEIVGMCSNGRQAIQRITELVPDLVFLDIQMPLMSGIEVLRSLPAEKTPTIIFLTAFDEHALTAFEVQALDYLLKPIDESRFFVALDRARRLVAMKQQSILYNQSNQSFDSASVAAHVEPIKRFTVRSGKELTFVETANIDWIEAAGDYAQLHVGQRTYLIRESLSTLETILDGIDFLRIHRSAIVQLDRIVRITALPNRDGYLMLHTGVCLRLSRSYSTRLRNSLKNRKPAEIEGK
jgi:two-component system, LytTR family, response regulator